MKQYSFEFRGQLSPGADQGKTQAGLAKLFQTDPAELASLFSGEAIFRREGLNEFTAKSYQQQFARVGAIGAVREQADRTAASPATTDASNKAPVTLTPKTQGAQPKTDIRPRCPKCQSLNIDATQCLDCGIILEKYRQMQERLQNPQPQPIPVQAEPFRLEEADREQKRAAKWLSWAGLILTIVFVSDSYLLKINFLYSAGIDLGYIPFFIGHLVLLRGCILYAESKGYSMLVGLLGLFSLAGLSILMLLPDHRRDKSGVTGKHLATAGACILVCVVWLVGFFNKLHDMSEIANGAQLLSAGRHEYPTPVLDSATDIYEREQKEMQAYLETSLKTIKDGSFRPSEITTLADVMFGALARYEAWRNYQRYRHVVEQQPLPTPLESDWTKQNQTLFATLLYKNIDREKQRRLYTEKQNWLVGANPDQVSPFWDKFSRYLFDVLSDYMAAHRNALYRQPFNKDKNAPPPVITLDLREMNLRDYAKLHKEVTVDTITYSATLGQLSHTPLTVAFYLEPYTQRFGKQGVLTKGVVISPDFPSKYLYGHFNVFNRYPVEQELKEQ
ncbi:hypothetical protein O5O45_00695 [Hahella aquimaris]|uniref:hypothetical protein n=1 Tax=Hahella sp. HNIBRBA332 TaxID=3015983 RepID=UPI00273C9925|nr:hypothetical protein [Hahella sp. HNIBRBA332]WLQ14453.1 hypothetical protein O5O45_00695 [Hahella sp. HNIBRBA332]